MIHDKALAQNFNYKGAQEYYWLVGDESKPKLFIIGGFTSTHSDYLDLAAELKNDFLLVIPDLPGWGRSEKLSHQRIGDYVDFIHALKLHLKFNKIQLAGHCMGSTTAILYSLRFEDEVEKLFLISTPYDDHTLSKIFFTHLDNTSQKVPTKFRPIFYFWRSRVITTPIVFFMLQYKTLGKKLSVIKKDLEKQPEQDEAVVEENWNSFMSFNYNQVKKINLPIHLIHGGKDIIISLKQANLFAKLFSKPTQDIISEAGHLPTAETPKTVANLILKY